MIRYVLFAVLASGAAFPVWSLSYFLAQDLGVHGQFHLCKYSNGKVYSVNAIDLCPLQVQDEGPPAVGSYQPPSQLGFKTGEYLDGMTKVCVYNVLGHTEGLRIGAVEMCPLSHDF